MKKKTFIQFLILILIFIILIFFYKIYIQDKKSNKFLDLSDQKKSVNPENSNLIYNLKYSVEGEDGISYTISSMQGKLNNNTPELILMVKVEAVMKGDEGKPLRITADKALYNSINFNTKFYDNVIMTYQEKIINSDNFDLVFEKNLATIYNNIIYKDPNTKLTADKIEIDILTKNSKIFMNDKQRKIKIINIK